MLGRGLAVAVFAAALDQASKAAVLGFFGEAAAEHYSAPSLTLPRSRGREGWGLPEPPPRRRGR